MSKNKITVVLLFDDILYDLCKYEDVIVIWKYLNEIDFNDSDEEIEKRKMIIVAARIHPGESNSSYVM